MSLRRFFVPPDRIQNGVAVLSSDQIHHLKDVLRLGSGDEVELFDGEGVGYTGTVEVVGGEVWIGSLRKLEVAAGSSYSLLLAAAIIRAARFEWILEKGTELGVEEFIPLKTRFSSIRLPEARVKSSLRRWRRIVQESSRQCGRFTVPKIQEPTGFDDLLAPESYPDCQRMMLYEKAVEFWAPKLARAERILLFIGPEGGWDFSEVEAARRAGCQIFSLGPRILRAETAALAAVALFQFRFAEDP